MSNIIYIYTVIFRITHYSQTELELTFGTRHKYCRSFIRRPRLLGIRERLMTLASMTFNHTVFDLDRIVQEIFLFFDQVVDIGKVPMREHELPCLEYLPHIGYPFVTKGLV